MTKVLDYGSIELLKVCAEDLDVVNAARVSLHQFSESMTEADEGLIRFLMRERHGTPFEHAFFKFRVRAPLFVFREWHRHRVGHSYNEWSARYSKMESRFYVPNFVLAQTGKPGAYTFEVIENEITEDYQQSLNESSLDAFELYESAIESGISKQQARLFLPVNIYSEMIWSCNPRSLMHFLSLRNSEQAQMEIRMYAEAAESFLESAMPVTHAAFVSNGRKSP